MGIEGIDYILNKQEVIPTVSASDLLRYAERVDTDYRRHVRTYVPMSRSTEGKDGQLSVEVFERKVIKAVKDARAPRGFLTAEYGYGKTSTALYLWKRAEDANLIAVPPFQMLELTDLVTAIHGWVRYRLSIHSPALVKSLDELYNRLTDRSLEQESRSNNVSMSTLQQWVQEGRFIMALQPTDFVSYFEDVTKIVLDAGFDGLLVLPDEIQQYIEPRVARSDDPIAPLFNLVQMLATRERYLKFGLIMVIPLKEIGVIREARGRDDLLHRMRELSIDLTSVYDFDFAKRLWQNLSKEFEFSDISTKIVTHEALDALGEISSREDLSNGPRTVINTFRRMVERYKTNGASTAPYTPIDLVDDFLSGAIQFAGDNRIQNVARRGLQSALIRSNVGKYENAVKLAAAYPGAGVPLKIQQKYGVAEAIQELMQQALGELVIAVGPIDQQGVTLFGLQVGVQENQWLPQTIRDFRRAYSEQNTTTKDRALKVFTKLVKEQIFKGWSVTKERQASFTSNLSIILEGEFQSFSTRYPKRKVHVRVLWEDEERKDAETEGDVGVEYCLSMNSELRDKPEERRAYTRPLRLNLEEHIVQIPINLQYVRPEGIPLQIRQRLQNVWSPYDLSPLVLMNIYQMLEDKRADNLIPRQDDPLIKSGFQPELLDSVMRDLFNTEIGAPIGGVSQARLTEVAVEKLLDDRYLDSYQTIMCVSNWRSSLQKYAGALDRLENTYQRRGEVEVEGTKDDIARLMVLTNAGLDSFVRTFGAFLSITKVWSGGNSGAVRFTLHNLEERIIQWLRGSQKTESVIVAGQAKEVRQIETSFVYKQARQLGYQAEEIDELLKLLVKRQMIEFYHQHLIREVPSQTIDLDAVAEHLRSFRHDISALLKGFSGNSSLVERQKNADEWLAALERQRQSGTPDPQQIHRLGNNIRLRQNDLRSFALDQQVSLKAQYNTLRRSMRLVNQQHLTALNNPTEGSVSYVDQVNVLRIQLRNYVTDIKIAVEHANAQLEQAIVAVSQQDLSYERLAHYAAEVEAVDRLIVGVNNKVAAFETSNQHLANWQRLVAVGSGLLEELQQIGAMTEEQHSAFESLSRDIRADISSQRNKLDALPNHSIYTNRLETIRSQVREIRIKAESNFVDLQQRYYQLLTSSSLYRREQLDGQIQYYVATPQESYRQLYDKIQRLAQRVAEQIASRTLELQKEAENILSTPLIHTLLLEDQQRIYSKGLHLIETAKGLLTELKTLESSVEDLNIIKDCPQGGDGAFDQLVLKLSNLKSQVGAIASGKQQFSQWLADISLSAEEEQLLSYLGEGEGDLEGDLVTWFTKSRYSLDEFWRTVRSLHEKHRIRIQVSRVRR